MDMNGMGIENFFHAPRQGLSFSTVEITVIIVNGLVKHKSCLTATPDTEKEGYRRLHLPVNVPVQEHVFT